MSWYSDFSECKTSFTSKDRLTPGHKELSSLNHPSFRPFITRAVKKNGLSSVNAVFNVAVIRKIQRFKTKSCQYTLCTQTWILHMLWETSQFHNLSFELEPQPSADKLISQIKTACIFSYYEPLPRVIAHSCSAAGTAKE